MTSRNLPRSWLRAGALSLGLAAMAGAASAGGIEDAFRGFVDRLRAQGRALPASLVGNRMEITRPTLSRRVEQLPLGHAEVAVFVMPGCRRCDQAVAHVRSTGMNYEVLDVSRSAVARDSFNLTAAKGFPVVLVGTQRVTGWDAKLFQQAMVQDAQEQLKKQQAEGGA